MVTHDLDSLHAVCDRERSGCPPRRRGLLAVGDRRLHSPT
jgi:hypothetical protein